MPGSVCLRQHVTHDQSTAMCALARANARTESLNGATTNVTSRVKGLPAFRAAAVTLSLTFQRVPHEERQEAELQFAKQLITVTAEMLL